MTERSNSKLFKFGQGRGPRLLVLVAEEDSWTYVNFFSIQEERGIRAM